jgi:hypothetical protein
MPDITSRPFTERLRGLPQIEVPGAMLWAAILMVILALVSEFVTRGYPADAPLHHDIFAPVLALELPHSRQDLIIVLSPPPPGIRPETVDQLRATPATENQIRILFQRATWTDFLFIASYTWFLIVAWKVIARGRSKWVLALIVFTACADVGENIGILRALDTPIGDITDSIAAHILVPSRIKWGAFTLVVLFVALALARVELKPFRRPGTGLLVIELVIAVVFGATGLTPDISSPRQIAGWFSHRHLETFSALLFLFPIVIIAAGLYERWRRVREERPSGGEVLAV